MNKSTNDLTLEHCDGYWRGRFSAMASPCEVLIASPDKNLATQLANIVRIEARRIEQKFSRYQQDNIIHKINHSNTLPVEVDAETADLLDFADQCYQLSEGLFDITSGVLREVWQFDGSDRIPEKPQVSEVLKRVGWDKVKWNRPQIQLQNKMQVDLGGIGKEYAVDKAAQIIKQQAPAGTGMLVNFGGDLVAIAPQEKNKPWTVGVDDPLHTGKQVVGGVHLSKGALATSGDARRFLLKAGKRYSHILNPKTGWPVENPPRSISVIANTCIEAGMLATFAMLHGEKAREFLEQQDVKFWCVD